MNIDESLNKVLTKLLLYASMVAQAAGPWCSPSTNIAAPWPGLIYKAYLANHILQINSGI